MVEVIEGQAKEEMTLEEEADSITVESFLNSRNGQIPNDELDSDKDDVVDSIAALGQEVDEQEDLEDEEVNWESKLEAERVRVRNAQEKMHEATEKAAQYRKKLEQFPDVDPEIIRRLLNEENQRVLSTKRKPIPIAELREDFGDVLADTMQNLQEQNDRLLNEQSELKNKLFRSQEEQKIDAHYEAIESAHPDFPAIYGSDDFKNYIKKLPDIARLGAEHVLELGTSTQINGLVTSYKNYSKGKVSNRSMDTARKYANPGIRSNSAPTGVTTKSKGVDIGYLRQLLKDGKVFSDDEEAHYDKVLSGRGR